MQEPSKMNKPIFRDLDPDDPEPETTEVESMCMNCHKNGITRLLLTKIPFYKEVVIMSFACDLCGFQNNEIQQGGEIQPKGVRLTLTVREPRDLNRRVVKSDFTAVRIEEVDFEIPAQSQKGEVTTVEGIVKRAIAGLEQDQTVRRVDHPEVAEQIDAFIARLQELLELKTPFTLSLEDISGNCHVENPQAPQSDPQLREAMFARDKEQNHALGIYSQDEVLEEEERVETKKTLLHPIAEGEWTLEDLQGEVLSFPTNCPECGAGCETNMKLTSIPHFKEVVIMATLCEACGHRTNEVKSGGGIEEKGVRIEVSIRDREDFSRDVLKSETCSLFLRELDCDVGPRALGGRFTTVEGLLQAMKDQLEDQSCMFLDSQDEESKERLRGFLIKLDEIIASKCPVTMILDDPSGNSYVQSLNDESPDDRLRIIRYHRSYDQNEELGLNDIKTENYGEEVAASETS